MGKLLLILAPGNSVQNFGLSILALVIIAIVVYWWLIVPLIEIWERGTKIRQAIRELDQKVERLTAAVPFCYQLLENFEREMPEQAKARLYNLVFLLEDGFEETKGIINVYRNFKVSGPIGESADRALQAQQVCEAQVRASDEVLKIGAALRNELEKLQHFKSKIPELQQELDRWIGDFDRVPQVTNHRVLLFLNLAQAGQRRAAILLAGAKISGGVDYRQVHEVFRSALRHVREAWALYIKSKRENERTASDGNEETEEAENQEGSGPGSQSEQAAGSQGENPGQA